VPIVLEEIRIGNIIYWFRRNYTTVQQARREAKFGDLFQGDMPIDAYYMDLVKTGKLLDYPDRVVENQFFRGLNADNLLEAERQADKPLEELVKSLSKIEKRKAEMKLGSLRRNAQYNLQQHNVIPMQAPPVASAQEPTVLKPVTSHAITQDMLDKLLKSHTESLTKNFQTQLQALQDTIARPQQKKIAPPIPPKNHRQMHEWYVISHAQNPFNDDTVQDQYTIEDIMEGNYYKPDKKSLALAQAIAKASARAKKERMDRQVDKIANALDGLNLDDDTMDTTALTDGSIILQDADGNEFTAYVTRGSKKK